MRKRQIKYLIMKHLGVRLTTYCNLNCKDCADLIPYTKDRHYDIDLLMQDMNKLLKVVDLIQEILLGGGEVFLYPELNEVLRFFIECNKVGRVIIVTNGTIIPSDATMELLKNEKVVVRVSGYGEDVAPKRAGLINILHKENIPTEDLQGMTWRDIGSTECRHRNQKELEQVWDTCDMNECEGMTSRGRIYFCSRAVAADDLGCCPAPRENEYVDVRNTPVDELGEKLEKFFDLKYISTCNYCDGLTDETPDVPVAAQMVPKYIVLELFQYEFMLKGDETNNELLLAWMEFVASNFEKFIYEEEVQKTMKTTLKAYENRTPWEAISAWNALNYTLLSKYDFAVENKSEVIQDSWCIANKQFGKKKNTIFVLVLDDDNISEDIMAEADIIISSAEIKEEKCWEGKTKGVQSVLRYVFDLEQM